MALLFSAVTVTAGEDEIELLVGGTPREYDDLFYMSKSRWNTWNWRLYFLQ